MSNGSETWNYATSVAGDGVTQTMTVTDPLGHAKSIVSNLSTGTVSSTTDALSRQTNYQYDGFGRVTEVTHPEGNGVEYCYDGRGNVLTTVAFSSNSGLANTTPFASCSTPPTSSGDANIVTTAGYDVNCNNPAKCNKPNWTKDANGRVTTYTYFQTPSGAYTGQLLTVTRPPDVNGLTPVITYGYTSMAAQVQTASGSTTTEGSIWLLTTVTTCNTTTSCAGTSDQTVETISYEPAQNLAPVSVTVSSGDVQLTTGANGWPACPSGGATCATTHYNYDNFGNVVSMTDARGGVTYYHYDADRRLVGVVSPDPDGGNGPLTPAAVRYTYSPDGLVTLTEVGTVPSGSNADWTNNFSPSYQSLSTLDALDRTIQTSASASGAAKSSLTQYQYDNANRLLCSAVRMNPLNFGTLSAPTGGPLPTPACQVDSTTGLYGPDRITHRTYDAADEPLTVASGWGSGSGRNDVTYVYSKVAAYGVDNSQPGSPINNGLPTEMTDANGNTTTILYDGFDRVWAHQFPCPTAAANCGAVGAPNVSDIDMVLSRDGDGDVTGYQKRDGTQISYSYDKLNRLTSDGTTRYTYDLQGRLLTGQGTASGSYMMTLTYDALGRKTSDTSGYGGSVASSYDAAGDRTRFCWQDGVCIVYGYDTLGRVTRINEAGQGSGPGLLASYGYDSLGQLTSFAYGGSSYGQSYAYDGIGRLATLGSTFPDASRNDLEKLTFGPDSRIRVRANSNNAFDWQAPQGVSQGYGVNGLDQTAWAGTTRFSYDGAGRLASDGTSSYGYSVYDQLTSMSGAAALGHDPLQRLASVTTASATTEFVYDGAMITEELNGSGAVLRRYVPGPDGTPLVWYEGSGETDRRWMLKDHQGSVTAVANTTQSSGLIALNTYDAYGVGGAANAGRFQYAGYPWIPETGLYETLARSYSPTIGRFLSTDPIGYGDGLNWYAYAHSDPINGSDPTGLTGQMLHNDYDPGSDYDPGTDDEGVAGTVKVTARNGSTQTAGPAPAATSYSRGVGEGNAGAGEPQSGGRGGKGGGTPANPGPDRTNHCLAVVAAKDGPGAALDGASIIPGGGLLGDVARLAAGALSFGISAFNADRTGSSMGAAGVVAGSAQVSRGVVAISAKDGLEAIPVVGTAVGGLATVVDGVTAANDMASCMAGAG